MGRLVKNGRWVGAWVAQSTKRPTLDFGSGHDLRVGRPSPAWGGVGGAVCAGCGACLRFSLFAPPIPSLKKKKKDEKNGRSIANICLQSLSRCWSKRNKSHK